MVIPNKNIRKPIQNSAILSLHLYVDPAEKFVNDMKNITLTIHSRNSLYSSQILSKSYNQLLIDAF